MAALWGNHVTMEEQLIFGALQTLNEEACEDVMEEQEKREEDFGPAMGDGNGGDGSGVAGGVRDLEVVYLQSSPLVSHKVVTAPPSDQGSAAPSLASSNFSPYKSNNASLSRASSIRCPSNQTSPKHSTGDRPPPPPQARRGDGQDRHRDLSPCRRTSSTTSSPLHTVVHRERPHSLVLEGTQHTASSPSSPNTDLLPSGTPSLVSLPDIIHEPVKHVSLTEQLSATSLDKLRRLKHRLHRALGSHEIITRDNSEEAETSPLVLATPGLTTPYHSYHT
ncbi:hypothetical protein GWK47_054811 [Chionoecetes opilio]|uniref:Uncharacterized protein n=1 Tax=Chionoecetes opilio TaxID=41210 RepID=A0A8J4XYP0_CHIOP|nr:hypothetical protein GWK47_054811 [Chionoecetes opilio]